MSGALLQAASVVTEPLKVVINNGPMSGAQSGPSGCSPGAVSTDPPAAQAVASGGKPPYSYAWTLNGGAADGGPFTPSAPSSDQTAWSDNQRCDPSTDDTESWRCTVTDDVGRTASATVNVTLSWTDTR